MIKKISLILLIITFFMIGCTSTVKQKMVTSNGMPPQETENISDEQVEETSTDEIRTEFIKFFIPDSKVMYWLIEEKEMQINDLSSIIQVLIDGGKNNIPKETKVLGVSVEDRIAYLNLSAEFNDYDTGSSCATNIKIYSIVNLLCLNECLNIDGVKFLIDGKEVDAIGPMRADDIKVPNAQLIPVY